MLDTNAQISCRLSTFELQVIYSYISIANIIQYIQGNHLLLI